MSTQDSDTGSILEDIKETEENEKVKEIEIERILRCCKLNPFAILQVSYHPTRDEIEEKFRTKIRLIHPDDTLNKKAPDAFDLLKRAYADLRSEPIRTRIDQLYRAASSERLGDQHDGPVLDLIDFLAVQTRFENILRDEELQRRHEYLIEEAEQKRAFHEIQEQENLPPLNKTKRSRSANFYNKNKWKNIPKNIPKKPAAWPNKQHVGPSKNNFYKPYMSSRDAYHKDNDDDMNLHY